jgi:glutamine amidotransferase
MNVIVDYNAGNITSLANALESLGFAYAISSDARVISAADRVLFPGQGHIAQAMRNLVERNLVDCISSLQQPFLGICVGAQLLHEFSEEGDTSGLGILPGTVKRFQDSFELKVPHMGWNTLEKVGDSPLMRGIEVQSSVYFVHSYACPMTDFTIAKTNYGIDFAAISQKDNFYGMQFHPEKSGDTGFQLLRNFLTL